jgi:transposase
MSARKQFTPEFKREAVQLLESGSRPASAIARELGLRRNQLYQWQRELRARGATAFPGPGARKERTTEVTRLKRELARVTEERDILKKAAVGSSDELASPSPRSHGDRCGIDLPDEALDQASHGALMKDDKEPGPDKAPEEHHRPGKL